MEIASLSKWRADEFGAFSGAIADFRIPFTQAIVDDVLALDVLPRMPTLRRLELMLPARLVGVDRAVPAVALDPALKTSVHGRQISCPFRRREPLMAMGRLNTSR